LTTAKPWQKVWLMLLSSAVLLVLALLLGSAQHAAGQAPGQAPPAAAPAPGNAAPPPNAASPKRLGRQYPAPPLQPTPRQAPDVHISVVPAQQPNLGGRRGGSQGAGAGSPTELDAQPQETSPLR
jgi:hypothetical protein